jgi:hypothetical protein
MVHSREIDDPERGRPRVQGLRRAPRVIRLAVALAALALGALFAPSALADDAKTNDPPDAIPGSPRPFGLGLSPEAPPVPPAPGGRAPSFGAPVHDGQWSLQIGGRIAGFEAVGIGRRPGSCASAGCTPGAPAGYSGTSLHVPPLVQGRLPF